MKNKNLKKPSLKEKTINNFQLLAIKGGTTSDGQNQEETNNANTGTQAESASFSSVDEPFVQDAGWIRLY